MASTVPPSPDDELARLRAENARLRADNGELRRTSSFAFDQVEELSRELDDARQAVEKATRDLESAGMHATRAYPLPRIADALPVVSSIPPAMTTSISVIEDRSKNIADTVARQPTKESERRQKLLLAVLIVVGNLLQFLAHR